MRPSKMHLNQAEKPFPGGFFVSSGSAAKKAISEEKNL